MDVKKSEKRLKNGGSDSFVNHANFSKNMFFWTPTTLFFHIFNPKVILLFRMKLFKLKKAMLPYGNIGMVRTSKTDHFGCAQ